MRKMIGLLVLGSSLAFLGQAAFADGTEHEHEKVILQMLAATSSDNPDPTGSSTITSDPARKIIVLPENDK